VAVAKGPGGFTGTRIGVVTARTLAQQLQVPLFGISSLAAMAAAQTEHTGLVAVQMPAQRGELFVAIYQNNLTILSERVLSPDDWQTQLAGLQQPYHLVQAPINQGISVEMVLHLAYDRWRQGERYHWSETLPFYGQHPVHR
jgi:tRNA threonylcarbamoyl adenosine modification protein YeaZ